MLNMKILYKRLSEIHDDGRIDGVPDLCLDQWYVKALKENPFRESKDVVCIKIGVIDGKVAGREYVFPILICCDGKVITAGSGSYTTVEKWARKTGLGIELSSMHEDCSDGDFLIGDCAGLSQMAVKVRRYFDQPIFEYPRYIGVLKSRSIIETKLKGFLASIATLTCDMILATTRWCLVAIAKVMSSQFQVEDVCPEREDQLKDMERVVKLEKYRFSEVHDCRWFKWVLTNSFSMHGPCSAYILRRNGEAIGFFMVKKRFHEQASHRGFKNVRLGSVIEWGVLPEFRKILLRKIYIWYYNVRRELDAVEFPAYENWIRGFLKLHGWQKVGNANFCYAIRPRCGFIAPKGMDDADNWRLRLGMGDCALN